MRTLIKYLLVILGSALFFFSSAEKTNDSKFPKQPGLGYQVNEKSMPGKTSFILIK